MSDNVLLNLGDEPRYSDIRPADIKPAMQAAMAEARAAIAEIKAQPESSWANTVERLTGITERVGRIWGVVSHLNSVVDTPELRAEYNALMPEVTVFFTEIGQDIELYNRFKAIKASPEFAALNEAQKTKLKHDLRDFVLSGAELPPEKQARLAELQTEGAQLAARFSQNVLDATDAFALYFADEGRLKGLTDDEKAMFAAAAEAEGKSGYKIGLQMPHYLAVMKHADDRELRAEIYRAYVTRASELSDGGKYDNTADITRRLEISLEEARILGFANYAELSLATKMAESPQQVLTFLRDLAARGVEKLLIVPMYPQYSDATTASVFDGVAQALASQRAIPELRLVRDWHTHPRYIAALADSIRRHTLAHGATEQLLFSFHGLPARYATEGDPYPRQCEATVAAVAAELQLPAERYRLVYQSRFGNEPWLQPYADETIQALAAEGYKNIRIICPGFTADCLETLEEMAMTNRSLFLQHDGTHYDYIPALNDDPAHIELLADLVAQHTQGWEA